jgi:hypothetical protein
MHDFACGLVGETPPTYDETLQRPDWKSKGPTAMPPLEISTCKAVVN